MKFYLRVVCWLTLFANCLYGQNPFVESLSTENGLSQGMIFDICQTSDGFLWIATKHGLNRYDGYNFKIFIHNRQNPFSLAENTITALYEDSRGWLWVGTESQGVDVYNPHTEQFHHFPLKFDKEVRGAANDVRSITEAPDGAMYILQSGNGVVRITIPDSWAKLMPNEPDLSLNTEITLYKKEQFAQAEANQNVNICQIVVQPNQQIWAYGSEQVYQLLLNKSGAIQVIAPEQVSALSNDAVIWCPIPNGLVYYKGGKPYSPNFSATGLARTSLAKPFGNGAYWIALNNKLWYVRQGELPDFTKPDWEVDADISAASVDRNGNVWIGTQGHGLRKINPKRQQFKQGAAGYSLWGVWSDSKGRYYCKVINKVFEYNPQTGKLSKERAFGGKPWRVLDMCINASGNYWLLGRGEAENTAELRYYHPDTGESVGYSFPFDTLASASGSETIEQIFKPFAHASLLLTSEGSLLAAGENCRLIQFNPQTAQFEWFSYASLFGNQAASVLPFALIEDGNGIIWIGTQSGLVKCNPQQNSYEFELIAAGESGLNNNSVACLLPHPANPKQGLWIGTKGGGINYLNLQNGTFRHITTKEGLPDDVVYGILPGKKNELWCSTNRGLVKLAITETAQVEKIISYTTANGLQYNEFNTQAYFRAENGELLFGGVNGLNRFFPEEILPDTLPPFVYLAGLRINQQPAIFGKAESVLDQPIPYTNQLRLQYYQNNLTFEFAALDFTAPGKNSYRYRLVGADQEWVEMGNNRVVNFTHLRPGHYTLLAQGNNGEGNWQDLAQPVQIVIYPPWWQSTPAYLVYVLLVLGAIWQIYRFQIKRVKMREQLAFERRETERIKALEQMKTDFFSNVTHEFRTPLTLMLEPLRQLIKNPNDPNLIAKIRLAENNSRKLLALVNQLLDMAKLESGSMTLDNRKANFTQTLREVFEQFLPLAQKKQINLSFAGDQNIPLFFYDTGKVELIVNNLLSNALNFTPPGGKVILACHLAPKTTHINQPAVQVSVTDTGVGIPDDSLTKVFDRFYQVNGAVTNTAGTGIGLALTKELVELMGGTISVESKLEHGSVFTFWLPMQTDAPTVVANTGYTISPADFDTINTDEAIEIAPNVTDDITELPVVLIIEDNSELRSFIRISIGEQWQIIEAADGEDGINKAIELLPDVVISDLMMPRKDGYAVCAELKNNELTAHIPIILLTAKSAVEAKLKGLRTGADDYLTKPFNTEELLVRMVNLVEQRRQLRQLFSQTQPAFNPNMPTEATQESPAPDHLISQSDRDFLRRFTLLIEKNLDNENLSVEELAQKMFISRVQLHRKMKAITNQNVSDFVRNYRLERAMIMLQNQEGRVYEIADQVGFSNEKYFSRAFKEKFGIPPSQVQ